MRRAWQQCRAGNKCHPTVMFKCCSLHSEKSKSISFITCCQRVITQLSEHHIHSSDLQSTCVRTPPHPGAPFIVWVERLKLFSLFKHGMGRLSVEILTFFTVTMMAIARGCFSLRLWIFRMLRKSSEGSVYHKLCVLQGGGCIKLIELTFSHSRHFGSWSSTAVGKDISEGTVQLNVPVSRSTACQDLWNG